jgi:hypothetical protein
MVVNVGRVDVILKDDLEKEFRMQVAKSLGMKKGNLTVAIEEAVKKWVEAERKREKAATGKGP